MRSKAMRADPRHKPLPLEAATLLTEGKVAEAVESVRQAEGIGRRAARKRVDAHIANEPMLRVQLEMQGHAARRKFFLWFLLIDAVIVALAIYWFVYRDQA
jgi:hypothetical protein